MVESKFELAILKYESLVSVVNFGVSYIPIEGLVNGVFGFIKLLLICVFFLKSFWLTLSDLLSANGDAYTEPIGVK